MLWLSVVFVAWCMNATEEVTEAETDTPTTVNQDVNAVNSEILQPLTNDVSCKDAIAAYLAENTMTGSWNEVVVGDNIEVQYIGRFDDNTIFDTSVENIAASCGVHNPYRDYKLALPFVAGAWSVIKGFDDWVLWMKVGDTKTVNIPASDAYGEYDPSKTQTVTLDQLPPKDVAYKAWDELWSPIWKVTILEVNGDNVTIDLNHELAGKDLIFDITVTKITK